MLFLTFRIWLPVTSPGGGGGGGGALDFHVDGGGCRWGSKTWPVAMRSVHKKYTLSQYTLLQICNICIYPVAILHHRWCPDRGPVIKHCGLGTPGKQPCDKRSSPPVANLTDLDVCQFWWATQVYPALILMTTHLPCPSARCTCNMECPPPPPVVTRSTTPDHCKTKTRIEKLTCEVCGCFFVFFTPPVFHLVFCQCTSSPPSGSSWVFLVGNS